MRPHRMTGRRPFHVKTTRRRCGLTLIEVLVVIGILVLLAALLLPATRSAREAARRTKCINNLRNITLALHNYHSTYASFPSATTSNANGERLHSWRTAILPFISQSRLHESIDQSKLWDDPANARAAGSTLEVYRCPSLNGPGNLTTYAALVGPHAFLLPGGFRTNNQITDSRSDTLMLVEVSPKAAVPWMSPQDGGAGCFANFGPETNQSHPGGIIAAFADTHVRFLSNELSDSTRQALMTIDGGERIGAY